MSSKTTKEANQLTPFEAAIKAHYDGNMKVPSVTMEGRDIPFFKYQLAVVKYQRGSMSAGVLVRGVKLKDIKLYYGLKGRTAKDVKVGFMEIYNHYLPELKTEK